MTWGKPARAQGAVYYDTPCKGGRTRCVRGPIKEAGSLKDATLASNAGSVLRFEQVNHGLETAYYEVFLPEGSEA